MLEAAKTRPASTGERDMLFRIIREINDLAKPEEAHRLDKLATKLMGYFVGENSRLPEVKSNLKGQLVYILSREPDPADSASEKRTTIAKDIAISVIVNGPKEISDYILQPFFNMLKSSEKTDVACEIISESYFNGSNELRERIGGSIREMRKDLNAVEDRELIDRIYAPLHMAKERLRRQLENFLRVDHLLPKSSLFL